MSEESAEFLNQQVSPKIIDDDAYHLAGLVDDDFLMECSLESI